MSNPGLGQQKESTSQIVQSNQSLKEETARMKHYGYHKVQWFPVALLQNVGIVTLTRFFDLAVPCEVWKQTLEKELGLWCSQQLGLQPKSAHPFTQRNAFTSSDQLFLYLF